jgi:hypothetical protein
MALDLNSITEKLIIAQEEWEDAQIKLPPLELEYASRVDDLVLSSQRASQPSREAEANQIVRQEDIYVKYWEARLRAKIADRRLDTFKVISANLRNLAYERTS